MTTSDSTPLTATDRAVNSTVRWFADRGVNLAGAQTLTVTGRISGNPHRIPVNPLTVDGRRFLVAPRGVTDWVRNVRVDPRAELRRGRRATPVVLTESTDLALKTAVVEEYLSKWAWEVGRLLPAGLTADSSPQTLAEHLPVFEVQTPS
ncbi:MAG: nitroreductase/quinone reductase family protein [Gordonia sp. (in: high G+C Gram-positive bacteria)]|uniref:nitroreductase/quinone reductase family protein n=1 Tax=Gordonia sp. (in: high G+C Gram-positive bacteria) TaxID=84139 RepID=UPI0039E4718C